MRRNIIRKPSIKKSIKARTTGKLKRKVKGTINPFYGKKGIDYVTDPKKAIYNKVYHKTSFNIFKSDIAIHLLLLITTMGIGNIIYLVYKKKKK